jgi:hypothetical protein
MKSGNRRRLVSIVIGKFLTAVSAVSLAACFFNISPAQTVFPTLHNKIAEQVKIEHSTAGSTRTSQLDREVLALPTPAIAIPGEEWFNLKSTDAAGGDSGKSKPRIDSEYRAEPIQPLPDHSADEQVREGYRRHGFDWESAFRQSMVFLGIQHAFRLATEEGTRADLKGPFFRDYFKALRSLRGWNDSDPFIVNYIGHPMMGSVTGFIQVQNDPRGIAEEVGLKKSYWQSRLKAFGWSFAYSTQFELGLMSEASLGNIGIRPYGKAKNPMAYVDLVVTPVVGAGWLVGEDLLDRYVIRFIEDRIGNRTLRKLVTGFLNPTRSFANLLRGKAPWYRDNRY